MFAKGFLTAFMLMVAIAGIVFSSYAICKKDKTEQKEQVTKEYKIGLNKNLLHFRYVIIDEHQYLMYSDGYRGGITHSPKCDCFNK